jgi:hypothetical protein
MAQARRGYLTVQWSGPEDRHPPGGKARREWL